MKHCCARVLAGFTCTLPCRMRGINKSVVKCSTSLRRVPDAIPSHARTCVGENVCSPHPRPTRSTPRRPILTSAISHRRGEGRVRPGTLFPVAARRMPRNRRGYLTLRQRPPKHLWSPEVVAGGRPSSWSCSPSWPRGPDCARTRSPAGAAGWPGAKCAGTRSWRTCRYARTARPGREPGRNARSSARHRADGPACHTATVDHLQGALQMVPRPERGRLPRQAAIICTVPNR